MSTDLCKKYIHSKINKEVMRLFTYRENGNRAERMGVWEWGTKDEKEMILSKYIFHIMTAWRTMAVFHMS